MTIRSIFTGLTGLNSIDKGLGIIANNIANINTIGFRAGRATFDDLFLTTLFGGVGPQGLRGGINPRQIGSGVSMGSVDTIFSQGNLQTTGRLLDLAVQGDGFFVVRDENAQQALTRAGNFSLDLEGFIVDPGNGFRLQGRQANAVGQIDNTIPVDDLRIDFASTVEAQKTTSVTTGGNLFALSEPTAATVSSNLQGLFSRFGESVGLLNGDVIRFESGFIDLADPPNNVVEPIDLSTYDFGKGAGVIMTVAPNTKVEDLAKAIDEVLDKVVKDSIPGGESAFRVLVDSETGQFIFQTGVDALQGLRVGLAPRGTDAEPPPTSNRILGETFTTQGDPNFTRTLDVAANSLVRTEQFTQANRTSSIEIFDSQGNSRTMTLGFARDARPPEAIASTQIGKLLDRDRREIIHGGFPQIPTITEAEIDATNNTAVFTAYQVDNIVATQGVVTFNDSEGNMIAMRINDGAISINGSAFQTPPTAAPTTDDERILDALNVQGDLLLNVGKGFMGAGGFTESTTLENIRDRIESRINSALAAVVTGLQTINGSGWWAGSTFATDALGNTAPETNISANFTVPKITVELNREGAFEITAENGHLGAASVPTYTAAVGSETDYDNALANAAGGTNGSKEYLGLVLDLAAKTRSVRVSTLYTTPNAGTPANYDYNADNQIDTNVQVGSVTGFTATPFDETPNDLSNAFTIGDTDNADLQNVNPAVGSGTVPAPEQPTPPTNQGTAALGVRDSGVTLVPLSTGTFSDLTVVGVTGNFTGTKAFDPIANAFKGLFSPRGYGLSQDFDGKGGLDRPSHIPLRGIVAKSTDTRPAETNTFHTTGESRRNSFAWQAVVPNAADIVPSGTIGYVDFESGGQFSSYGGGSLDTPTINFDPDGIDPVNGGVDPLSFQLDFSKMTQFGASDTATLLNQNGRGVGNLESVSIAPDGRIVGVFSNGATRFLGAVVLAQVVNEGGLIQVGDTMFAEGANSGQIVIYDPGTGGTGAIQSGNLELSNVDIATEFTNLIISQRAFQANSRIITTNDEILTEVVNLVR